jgi:hypothetical protein
MERSVVGGNVDAEVLERMLVLRLEGRTGWVATSGVIDLLLDLRVQCADTHLLGGIDDRLRSLAFRNLIPASEVEALIRDVLRSLDRLDHQGEGLIHRRRRIRPTGV